MAMAGKLIATDADGAKLSAIEWITDEDRFAELAPAWDAMLPDDARPFDLHSWYSTWWKAFGGSGRLAVCAAWRGDELEAVFPLMRRGRRLSALANAHSSVFRPLARDQAAMQELAAAVIESAPASLELLALPSDDPSVAALEHAAGRARMLSLTEPVHTSPIVETDGDFEAWRAASKPRWGAPLERFRRKMGRDHEARFEIVEVPQDLEAELDVGFAVEASGWKGRSKTAILSAPETEQFYRGVARVFHERGALRFSRIVLDDAVAAFDLCLLWNNRYYLLKTGYDERFGRARAGPRDAAVHDRALLRARIRGARAARRGHASGSSSSRRPSDGTWICVPTVARSWEPAATCTEPWFDRGSRARIARCAPSAV